MVVVADDQNKRHHQVGFSAGSQRAYSHGTRPDNGKHSSTAKLYHTSTRLLHGGSIWSVPD